MKPFELAAMLTDQAAEIAREGHNGWGNTMTDAARTLTDQAAEVERLTADLAAARDGQDALTIELARKNARMHHELAAARAERGGLADMLRTLIADRDYRMLDRNLERAEDLLAALPNKEEA